MKKVIKDPIHRMIEFEGEFELSLKNMLNDPFFQRLRRVKQLGFSDFVFPSATHSRFAHSLGVYAVAKRMLKIVEPESNPGEWSEKGQACLAAALLHDVGHGMFSHAFEKAAKKYCSNSDNGNTPASALLDACKHEDVTKKIIRFSSVREELAKVGGKNFPELVADMIDNKKNPRCIYTSIVASQLDADRLDYAARDSYFAGVSSGKIGLNWLMRNLQTKTGENGEFLFVDSKAYVAMEQFIVTLFQLYPTIYLHKKTRGLEYMFSNLLCRIFELVEEGREQDAGIDKDHPLARFVKDPEDLNNALLLDDALFWGSLYRFCQARDAEVCNLAKNFLQRKIPPVIDVWELADSVAAKSGCLKDLDAAKRVKNIDKACRQACSMLQDDGLLDNKDCYYDHQARKIYKPMSKNGDPQQINVKVGDEFLDIESISPLVASAASFSIHRVYYAECVGSLGAQLEKKLREALKQTLCG